MYITNAYKKQNLNTYTELKLSRLKQVLDYYQHIDYLT